MAYDGAVIEIPLGTLGLTGSKNPTDTNPGFLTLAENLTFVDGIIQKEGGASRYNATAISGTPTILGGTDWYTNGLAQRMVIAASDGKLYKDSGTGTFPTTLKSGLSASMRPYFVHAGKEAAAEDRKLFVFTGTNVVQVLADDGATTADIASPPADWSGSNQPTFGLVHRGCLMAGGNANDPHRLYISLPTDHEDFTSAGAASLSIYPGEGEALIGGLVWNHLVLLWKRPRGIYAIDMRDATAANWTIRPLTRAVGGISPWAIVPIDNDIIFLDATGNLRSLVATERSPELETFPIDQPAGMDTFIRSKFSLSRLNVVKGVYYAHKRELHFAYTDVAATVNNRRLILDFNKPGVIRFLTSTRDVCESLWLRRDALGIQRPLVGDNAGFVWTLDQTARNKNNAGYIARLQTVPTDLRWVDPELAHREKNGVFLELVYDPGTFDGCSVDVLWDRKKPIHIDFVPTELGAALGSFVLGTHTLGGTSFQTIIKRLPDFGTFVAFRLQNTTVNQNMGIARLRLYYTLGN